MKKCNNNNGKKKEKEKKKKKRKNLPLYTIPEFNLIVTGRPITVSKKAVGFLSIDIIIFVFYCVFFLF